MAEKLSLQDLQIVCPFRAVVNGPSGEYAVAIALKLKVNGDQFKMKSKKLRFPLKLFVILRLRKDHILCASYQESKMDVKQASR